MPHNRFNLGFAKYSYKRLRSLVYENENNNNISDKVTKNACTPFFVQIFIKSAWAFSL